MYVSLFLWKFCDITFIGKNKLIRIYFYYRGNTRTICDGKTKLMLRISTLREKFTIIIASDYNSIT